MHKLTPIEAVDVHIAIQFSQHQPLMIISQSPCIAILIVDDDGLEELEFIG